MTARDAGWRGGADHLTGDAMGESMVLIRTFRNETEAGTAQEELRASGIQSLLFSEDAQPAAQDSAGEVHLAVHQRDQTIAEAVLNAVLNAQDRPSGRP